ncbi:MAG: DUF389 domain-containing protein [Thermoleophilia bacterium]|nr:DUF389 domain-containing protein [Thermoleophilia bacterium]
MIRVTAADVARMRDQLFFEGPDRGRRLSRFWLLLLLSAVIAGAGVMADSTATVIGAMIVAPLMTPILGTMLAVVLADRDNLLRSVALVASGAASVVAVGYLLGLAASYDVLADVNSQVAGRVSPRVIDLIAALATGAVGSVALVRSDISDTLPGVAIAISLVPPLAVVGLTLESGSGDQALGALLLFGTNVTAILASGLVVMAIAQVQRVATGHAPGTLSARVHRGRAIAVIAIALLAISVPLVGTSVRIAQEATAEDRARDAANAWGKAAGWEVTAVSTQLGVVQIRLAGPLPEPDTATLRGRLDAAGLSGTDVRVELIPARTVDLPG